MQEVRKRNLDLLTEAMRGLEKGYNDLDFRVMSQALDNIALMNSHFRKYIEAKKEYRKDNNEIDKRNSIRELEAFLNAMYGILEEMKTSSDFQEEREMVRDKLREMFSVYQ